MLKKLVYDKIRFLKKIHFKRTKKWYKNIKISTTDLTNYKKHFAYVVSIK